MADLWLPGVQRLDCSAHGLALGKGNATDAYHTWHTFEGVPADYNFTAWAGARYLALTMKLAHFTFNPVLGGIVQLLRADQGARTLAATTDPRYDVNRRGRRHMQTEVIANARRPFTLDMTRAGLDDLTRLMNFLRSHGVEDQWAWREVIRPPANYAGANAPGNRRMPDRSGHAFHSKWPVPPGVDGHWDPGAIAPPWTLLDGARPSPAPPPRRTDWPVGWIADRQEELKALGYYRGEVDDSLGPLTEGATREYQEDRGGLVVDGQPGQDTATALGEDMATVRELKEMLEDAERVTLQPADYKDITGKDTTEPVVVSRNWWARLVMRRVYNTLRLTRSADRKADEALAGLAAVRAAVESLATGGGVDVDAVMAAAEEGAARALGKHRLEFVPVDDTDDVEV